MYMLKSGSANYLTFANASVKLHRSAKYTGANFSAHVNSRSHPRDRT